MDDHATTPVSVKHASYHTNDEDWDVKKEDRVDDDMRVIRDTSTSKKGLSTPMMDHLQFHASKIPNQSMGNLSFLNETYHGTSSVHTSFLSKSLAVTPYFEMDVNS